MAATIILFDKTKQPMAGVVSALQQIRDGVRRLGDARAVMVAECNGTTDTAAHFAQLATQATFAAGDYADANAAALQAFAEVDSLYSKLTAVAGVGDATGAAIAQCAGKLGVA